MIKSCLLWCCLLFLFAGCSSTRYAPLSEPISHEAFDRLLGSKEAELILKSGHKRVARNLTVRADTIFYMTEMLWQEKSKEIETKRVRYIKVPDLTAPENKGSGALLGAGIGIAIGAGVYFAALKSAGSCEGDGCLAYGLIGFQARRAIPILGGLGGIMGAVGSKKRQQAYEIIVDTDSGEVTFQCVNMR